MTIDDIMAEWKKDSFIDKTKIGEEAIRGMGLHSKYLDMMMAYKHQLLKLDSEYAIMRKLRIRYYNGQLTKEELVDNNFIQYQGRKLLKSEMNEYLAGDDYLTDISKRIVYQKNAIYSVEQIIYAIKNWTFHTGNYIEYEKFKAGY